MTTPDTAPAVLAALTPPAPTWLGLDANSLWTALARLSEEHRTGILERLIADAVEMRGAQAECADLADQRDTAQANLDAIQGLARSCAAISRTVTASYPPGMDAELVMRRRVGKIFVEAGELSDAIEGYTGENPRKGHYATADDVLKELIDCASASMCAIEYLTGDLGRSLGLVAAQVAGNWKRLSAALAIEEGGRG